MGRTANKWKSTEYVTYEEYAMFGISAAAYDRNFDRSEKLGISEDCRCPLCAKPLKEGSYKTLMTIMQPNGVVRYYNNDEVEGTPIKVGNGCFRNLMKAYNKKYK